MKCEMWDRYVVDDNVEKENVGKRGREEKKRRDDILKCERSSIEQDSKRDIAMTRQSRPNV